MLAAGLLFLGWQIRRWLREERQLRFAELDERLLRHLGELTARLEAVKGDLRTDFTDRLQAGLLAVREGVEHQLAAGRSEQDRRLADALAALEERLERLRAATDTRLAQLNRDAAENARVSREELRRTLAETTEALRRRVESLEQRTAGHLEAIRTALEQRLQAINDQVQQKLEKNLQEGFAHFQKVQEHLQAAEARLQEVGAVGQSIHELNNLLKLPHLRGQFGEAQLGRLLADFLPAGAYAEQYEVVPGSREQVDAVVRFPNFLLPIDSKFNREQVLPLFEDGNPARIEQARRQLEHVIRQQARAIRDKYVHPEHGTTDLALMFLPSETLYFEVIRNARLCETLHRLKVFPVSPNTLAITLRTIGMSIRQYEFARNIESTLAEIRKANSSFELFQKRFEEVGRGLERAQAAYQTASGHLLRYANRVVRLTGETDDTPPLPGPERSATGAAKAEGDKSG
ncbi:MAG: DNA recombination protein RmuC [Verrucomicrobia bacterium]|nr:MAG: DNA recombination protein RmuC [Verrucomicrobiota bacterium]